jgi:hypothetical protein
MAQSILQYHGRARKLFIDSLAEVDESSLKNIFDTSGGSFLLEKMSSSIPEKKFIDILNKLPLDKIAFGRHGSRAIEGVWKTGSIKLRGALCVGLGNLTSKARNHFLEKKISLRATKCIFLKNKFITNVLLRLL